MKGTSAMSSSNKDQYLLYIISDFVPYVLKMIIIISILCMAVAFF